MADLEQKCYTYSSKLVYGSNDGTWDICWKFEACPSPMLTYSKNLFKKGVIENAKIIVYEETLFFKSEGGEFALPNDPVTLDVLEKVIQHAREIQKPFNEQERVNSIRGWKNMGYLDLNASEDSPIDKNFYEKSFINEIRKEHEKLRKDKKSKKQ